MMLGKTEGKKTEGKKRLSWLDSITDSIDMNLSKLWEIVKNKEAWCVAGQGLAIVRHDVVTEQQ